MSRFNRFLQNVYIADGFADDCDELIHRCLKVDFLKFNTFCEIWKDMQLSCMYQGRTSGAEIAELSEEALHVAKHYMVSNTDNFEESVAGLFLVYAILNLQPFTEFASLRIVQEDLPAIYRIATVARRDRRFDVLYILGWVLTTSSQYHAAIRERGMEYPIRKYLGGHASIDQMGVRPKGVFFRQNEELDLIRELAGVEQRYNAAKAAVTGSGNPDRNLSYTNVNFAKELGSSLKNLIRGIVDDDAGKADAEEEIESSHSIKKKAMKTRVGPMKHLVTVENSQNPQRKSPTKKSDIKSTPGKVKTGSPTKPLATNTAKRSKTPPPTTSKRKTTPTQASKKRKTRITFDSDDDSNSSLPSLDDSSGPDIPSPKTQDETTQDTVTQTITSQDSIIQDSQDSIIQESVTQEQEINIKIDSLPCFIRSEEGGKFYEIEIIDELKNKNAIEKLTELSGTDVTVKKITDVNETSIKNETIHEMAEISLVKKRKTRKRKAKNVSDFKDKSVKKKVQKNTIIKSKLKRLGTLSMADWTPK